LTDSYSGAIRRENEQGSESEVCPHTLEDALIQCRHYCSSYGVTAGKADENLKGSTRGLPAFI